MTRVFSFDAETDGLYGEVWAIGVAILNTETSKFETWSAQIDPEAVTDRWVRENIVPIVDLERVSSREKLLDGFWDVWMRYKSDTICVADFGAPVEAGLFRACVEQDVDARMWDGPYPMHELGTALLLAGVDPDVNRREFAGQPDLVQHDPLHDAIASALCWVKAQGVIKHG